MRTFCPFAAHFESVSSSQNYEPEFLQHKATVEIDIDFGDDNLANYNVPFTITELENVLTEVKNTAPGEDEIRRQKIPERPQTFNEFSHDFSAEELEQGLKDTKIGKAACFDGIYPEFLVNCGRATRLWLVKFFNGILNTGSLPPEFKRTKIVAILKPGKPQELPESYRPIALLSCCYKLLERLLHNRICPAVDVLIPVEQAGPRSGSSCTDQVLSLTTHIEAGFERGLRTSVAFIDLTAAYDTVWREGLIYKLLRVIPCLKMCHLITTY
ncbi:hypothetical protein JTB14_005857 [Gonioctena quinquepunctata]|nr:hypothetical protein JTB14_005857 [Gonioctena quinquepunctata]